MQTPDTAIQTDAVTQRRALTFILATVSLDAIGIGLIFPVMPMLLEEVTHGTLSQAALWGGVLATVFAVMQFLCGPLLGSLSDRFGRRPVLLVSLAIMVADYVALALAPTIWLLVAARVVAGAAAATHATATAYVADITAPEDRGRRFGLIGACFGLGFVLGPLIGGLVAGIDSRAPFWVAAALALANLIFGLVSLPESLAPGNRRAFSLARANPVGALMAVGRLPGLRLSLAAFLTVCIAMNVYPAIWSFYGAAFGWDGRMIGFSLALYGLFFAAGQAFLIGPLIARFGEHRAALGGMVMDVVTLTALGVTRTGWVALVITPFTALSGVVMPALQAILSARTPADAQGELQGVLASLNAIAMIVTPMIMTATFSAFTREGAPLFLPGAPFLLAALMMVVAVLLHVAASRERPASAP